MTIYVRYHAQKQNNNAIYFVGARHNKIIIVHVCIVLYIHVHMMLCVHVHIMYIVVCILIHVI